MNFESPLLLSTRVSLTNNATLQANPTDLLNPNNTAMLIDQFRFSLQLTQANYAVYESLFASIQIGNVPLTNGLTPLVSLCPAYDQLTEQVVVWHLPKPLYVPPNVVTYINVLRSATYQSGGTLAMDVVVAGRSLPANYPVPDEIYVPWATSAVFDKNSNQITTVAGRSTLTSPDNALGNPHTTDLMVTRFIGFRAADPTVSTPNDAEGPDTTTLKMSISNGKLLVREPTPWYHLFPASRRYFDMRAILRGSNSVKLGGEFVRAQFSWQPFTGYSNIGTNYLGMIGYRKVQTPVGAPIATSRWSSRPPLPRR